jgi:hypothetical protein
LKKRKLTDIDYKKIIAVDDLSDGVAAFCMLDAKNQHRWGYIDNKTNIIVAPIYQYRPSRFSDGLAAIKHAAGTGFIDKKGRLVIQPVYSDVGKFSEGLCWCKKTGSKLYGYINKKGIEVISADYNIVSNFDNGRALVAKDQSAFIINKSGKAVSQALSGYYGF